MEPLDAARWPALSEWLDALEPLAPDEQAERLTRLEADDPATAAELRSLLAAAHAMRATGFLEGTAAPRSGPPERQPGARIGPWALVERVGHGGMGEVWRAHRADGRYDGPAAIKLPLLSRHDSRALERFHREGALLARLRHPGIAQLLDAGVTPEGQPYLVLEWVEGESIDKWCTRLNLGFDARITLFIALLKVVGAAHGQLAIHRDLKPSNILVDASGAIKLLDFGIARLLDEEADARLTREGVLALTPAYAAPEQFENGALGVTTDVFALGVVLFELLVGAHPSGLPPGSPPLDYLRAATRDPPPRASNAAASGAKALAGDLDNILACAMAADPAQRYVSAQALSDDLVAHLQHRPISVRRASAATRARKFVQRNRLLVATAGTAGFAVLAGLFGTAMMAVRSERSAQVARAERDATIEEITKLQRLGELNAFVTMSLPAGEALTPHVLLTRSLQFVEQRQGMAPRHRALLLSSIGDGFITLGDVRSALASLERAKHHAALSSDPGVRADVGCNLAVALASSQRFAPARVEYRAALAQLPDAQRYLPARINCLQQAESVEREAGNTTGSIEFAETAVRLNGELVTPNPRGHNDSLHHLAMAYQMGGRLQQAQAAYEAAEHAAVQLGLQQTAVAAILHENWASLHLYAGKPLAALAAAQTARAIRSAAQGPENVDAEMVLTFDELALRQLGRLPQARRYSDRLVDYLEAAGHQVAGNIAQLHRIAILRELGELDAADKLVASAGQRFAPLPEGNYHFGVLELERGLLAGRRGLDGAAQAHLDRSVALLRESSNAALYLPLALLRRAEWAVARQHPDAARTDADEARRLLLTSIGRGSPSLHLGDAANVLGTAAVALGHQAEAREAFLDAVTHYAGCLGDDHPTTLRAKQLAAR